jgi:hypothetical protein
VFWHPVVDKSFDVLAERNASIFMVTELVQMDVKQYRGQK